MLVLARSFLEECARQYRKPLEGFTPEAEALLRSHRWPGNVRELKTAISSAAVMADGRTVDVELLGQVERAALAGLTELPKSTDRIMTVEELELAYVTRVVGLCNGNKALAAQKLGVSRQTLSRWLAEPTSQ